MMMIKKIILCIYILFIQQIRISGFELDLKQKKNLNQEIRMFCNKLQHLKNWTYCEDCAISGNEASLVFFCDRCHRDIRDEHQSHKDEVKQIEHKKFLQPYNQLKSILTQQIMGIRQKVQKDKQSEINIKQLINKLKTSELPFLKIIDQKQKFIDIIRDQKIMKWILQVKFWECSVQRSTFMKFENRFHTQIEKKFIGANDKIQKLLKPEQQSFIAQSFKIDWDQNDTDQILSKKAQNLRQQSFLRKKQQQIYNVVLKMFQSYTMQECYSTDDEIRNLILRYPDSKVLYLCRIKLNELLPSGNEEIKRILTEIVSKVDKSFDSTDFYHYYTAMTQWQILDQKDKNLIFFELKNKKYYRMIDPDAYIDSLNKAIGIKQRPVYYISLGLGHVVKQNFHQALRVFKKANTMLTKRNDCLDVNMFWTQTQMDPNYRDFQAIMENLQTRTLQFIVNICKYFKKSQNYQELVECCQQLTLRQPNNSNFKIQFIKSVLSYSSTLRNFEGEDNEKIQEAEYMIIQLKNAQENSAAGQLDKRLKRLRAKNEFSRNQFYSASQGYENLARGTKFTTASDYYNHAASLYKLFVEEQCVDEDTLKRSYEVILKALNLRPENTKYKKLKFFICVYMNKFNEANQEFQDLKKIDPKIINEQQYERLIEYIKDNQQN